MSGNLCRVFVVGAICVSVRAGYYITGAVVAEVTAWQARPLEPMYPVVFFDALRVKISR